MKRARLALFLLIPLAVVAIVAFIAHGHNVAVLNPKGLIALKERNLMVTATLLMLIVVVPVYILTFSIAWKYRAGNDKAKYMPDWDGHRALELTWWAIPAAIILTLAVITWQSTHELDPYKPLASTAKPLTIQVVAMQWKWLFIYPDQHIATVNEVRFPKDTPINFEITSDGPMNSFWIPQLGGQIYAMAGMETHLHLMANEAGTYRGSSANISGQGFAGMKFTAQATSQADFDAWVGATQHSPQRLGLDEYSRLSAPSQNNPPAYYALQEQDLYDREVMKYMADTDTHGMDME